MRKITNLVLLILDFAITALLPTILYFSFFYLGLGKTYSENTLFIIWLYFFLPPLLILIFLLINKKARTIVFSKAITLIAGLLFLIYFSLYYIKLLINTYQAYFQNNLAKSHDYASVPSFISMTLLIILASIFFIVRKCKKKLRRQNNK